MRVAHLAPVFPPSRGGMGTVAYQQARALAASGVSVTVFTPRMAKPVLRPPGVEVVELPALLSKGNAACLPQVLWRAQHFDLIHVHYPFFGTAELIAARRHWGGPPVVLQYQMDVIGRGWFAHFFRWHHRFLLPHIVRAADGIVVTTLDYASSSFLGAQLSELQPRLAVIPPGVDSTHLSPNGNGETDRAILGLHGQPLIFFLSPLDRAHYFKGVTVLFEALRQLPDAGLVIGGEGDLRPHYEARARAMGLSDRVRFTGDIPDEFLPSYYRAADVVVLPSVDRTEAFGLVLLEAMACGRPVVASRLPGVRTLIEDGRNGYLVEPGDPSDLALKISYCAQQIATLGAQGRKTVEEHYCWPNIAQQLLRLYEEVTHASCVPLRATIG